MTRAQRNRRRGGRRGRPRNKAFLALMVVFIGVLLAGLSAVGYVVSLAASAPPLTDLKPRDLGVATQVYAADGRTRLGFIQAESFRQTIPRTAIPKVVKDATVAIEDERYYEHKGVDYVGIVRAALKNFQNRKTIQGGSTITMQLVRSLYITPERTFERKVREAKLAEELENEHTKDWILDKYLNSVPYGTVGGQTALGVQAAARMYFSKPASKLELHEAALLAGLPQAPTTYSPTRSPERAIERRNQVLDKMAELRMASRAEAEAAKNEELGLDLSSKYFTARRESYFFDYVKDELIKAYGPQRVRKGGLKVYTTIDLARQKAAKASITKSLAGVGPSSAVVTIDPENGYIKAMASSADYAKRKFNLAAQGHRQPGSVFKIMTLMTALKRGVDPNRTFYNGRSPLAVNSPEFGKFQIKNYGGSNFGTMSLHAATLSSVNTIYIQLAMDVGPQEVKRTAREMGIRSKLNGYPAESLGGLENGVSPLEVANAFATIASGGYRNRPTAVTKVVFPDGKVEEGEDLHPRFKVRRTRVFSDGVAYEAIKILKANMSGGTGKRAIIGCPAGGKTGTTDKNNDAWFAGFTPKLSTAVWVGFPDAQIQMSGLYHGANVDGGTFPAEIWGDYMRKAKGGFCGDFEKPAQPATFKPFFGKFAKTGTFKDPDSPEEGVFGEQTPAGGKPEKPAPATGVQENTTGGGGGAEFDPNLYESPPQGDGSDDPDIPQPGNGNGNGNGNGGDGTG